MCIGSFWRLGQGSECNPPSRPADIFCSFQKPSAKWAAVRWGALILSKVPDVLKYLRKYPS